MRPWVSVDGVDFPCKWELLILHRWRKWLRNCICHNTIFVFFAELFATCSITFKEYNKKPNLLINLPFEHTVNGVAVFDRQIFEIFRSSSKLHIYDSHSRYFTMSIVSDTSKKVNPSDIIASKDSVYVCDGTKQLVHRVKLPEEVKSNWLVTNVSSISTLSVTKSNNILVACKKLFSDQANEYTADGSFIREIEFENISITHVIEHNKFLLACEDTFLFHDLSLNNNDGGCLIRAKRAGKHRPNSDPLELDNPSYVVEDRNGFIFVADRNKNRIMVYNPKLEYVNQWNVAGQPHRLCLDEKQKKLYVSVQHKIHRDLRHELLICTKRNDDCTLPTLSWSNCFVWLFQN